MDIRFNGIFCWFICCQKMSQQTRIYPIEQLCLCVYPDSPSPFHCPFQWQKLQIPIPTTVSHSAYSPLPPVPINTADSPTCSSENPSSPVDVADTIVRPGDETVLPAQSAATGDVLSTRTFSCPWADGTEEGDCWRGHLARPWSSVSPRYTQKRAL